MILFKIESHYPDLQYFSRKRWSRSTACILQLQVWCCATKLLSQPGTRSEGPRIWGFNIRKIISLINTSLLVFTWKYLDKTILDAVKSSALLSQMFLASCFVHCFRSPKEMPLLEPEYLYKGKTLVSDYQTYCKIIGSKI